MSTPMNLLTAAQAPTLSQAAQRYCQEGLSVLPLQGKRPALATWKAHQTERASLTTVQDWITEGLFQNVGLVCGAVSQNLVVLDLDGRAGYPAFAALFPELSETYTVATGSGQGSHVYWQVAQLPESIKAMQTPIGNLEICANGRQVVAPPSIHPDTGQPYRIQKALPVLTVENIDAIVQWVQAFQTPAPRPTPQWQPPTLQSTGSVTLNPHLLRVLADHFSRLGYKTHGEWLHGPCIYPQRHQHGDRHPSFGFNTQTGYGHCYVCGTLLSKDICEAVGIHPDQYGGLVEKTPSLPTLGLPRPSQATYVALTPLPVAGNPPLKVPSAELVLENLSLPPWLQEYLDWAGATGNQTPMSFHLFSGLWLAATAIGRRLYAEAPWGQTIYPNLYTIVVAVSTFYRKSTAYRLAEQVANQVFPHLLLPTPGSPERLLTSLAGALPPNFKDLTATQQEQLQLARPFAAQRALRVDEIAGLLSAVNKRDYMVGMKDHLLEIYDCPPVLTRDIQTGLTIIERPTLSIFGLTTPAALTSAVGFRDWLDGLFPRFLLISPESNYQERPPLTTPRPIPEGVIQGLAKLFNRLPTPPDPHSKPLKGLVEEAEIPTDLEWAVKVECWEACMAYGERLRRACDPQSGNTLEERLRPLYGRLHVQALKLAMLLSALRWLESADPAPTITQQDWDTAEALAEYLRASAHQLLLQLDRSGEASREQSLQDRMLEAFASGGTIGRTLREVYRHLHLPAKQARQLADDLVLAGLLIRSTLDGAESYSVRLSQAG